MSLPEPAERYVSRNVGHRRGRRRWCSAGEVEGAQGGVDGLGTERGGEGGVVGEEDDGVLEAAEGDHRADAAGRARVGEGGVDAGADRDDPVDDLEFVEDGDVAKQAEQDRAVAVAGVEVALAGAYVLAGELHRAPEHAFARYEAAMRDYVRRNQDMAVGASFLFPRTRHGLWLRNRGLRAAPLLSRLSSGIDRNATALRIDDYRAATAA